jgi:hypothetical protein
MGRVYIVDRVDQVTWYVPKEATKFTIKVEPTNKIAIRKWLEEMSTDDVVISGQGVMPRCGTGDHAYATLYREIQQKQFAVHFASDADAMAFKLTWGGDVTPEEKL